MPDARVLASAFGLAALIAPAPAMAQGLADAYNAALRLDPDHAAAEASRDASNQNDALADSLFRPKVQVEANGGYSRLTSDSTLIGNTGLVLPSEVEGTSGAVFVGMELPLINGDADGQARQLRAGAKAGREGYEVMRNQLALRVARAYFDVLLAEDALATLQSQEATARREQAAAQARFDAGRAKITDVREAQSTADMAAAQIIAARTQRNLAASKFRELTGFDASNLHRPRADLFPIPPGRTLADWQKEAETRSPFIEARQQQLAVSEAGVDRYSWSSQIQLTARAGAGEFWRGGNDLSFYGGISPLDRADGVVVGLQLKIPLYTGGALEAKRSQALASAREAEANVRAAQRDIRLQVEQAWSGQQSGAEQILALRTALASAQLQEQAAITGRDVGVRTQSDVLAAQTQTFDAIRKLNQAIYDYEFSRIALHAAVGDLSLEHLAEVDRDLSRP